MYSARPLKAVQTSLYVRGPQERYRFWMVILISPKSNTLFGGNGFAKRRQTGSIPSIIDNRTIDGFICVGRRLGKDRAIGGLEWGIS